MKRTISIILAVVLTMAFSLSTFAISLNDSFKGPLTELDENEYIFSFGKLEEGETAKEIGFKVGGKKYTLSDAALFRANASKTFGIGFMDNENKLGDSYDIVPYFIDENGEEKSGELYTVNKEDYADQSAGVKLANISVNGTPLSFFKETVKTYDYGISYEDMEVNNPTVTAVAKEETSTVSYAPFSTGVNITVTDVNGLTDTYTVNFKPESANTTTKIAAKVGTMSRNSSEGIVYIDPESTTTYLAYIKQLNIGNDEGGDVNLNGVITYMDFDIPDNINIQEEITLKFRVRTVTDAPSDLKIYAYEYNENALPYYEYDDSKDNGNLGAVINPEGWVVSTETRAFIDLECDISDYIAKLVALNKKTATVALYFDSEQITSLWKESIAGTYTGNKQLSLQVVANTKAVKETTAASYKDGEPVITYSTFDSYTAKNLAYLSDIKVGGTTIAGFAEDKYEYSLGVDDINNLPEVTATAKYPNSQVDITTDGTSKVITVTYGNYEATYTVNFSAFTQVTKSSVYQASKQIQTAETSYKAVELSDTTGATLSVRGYVNLTQSLSSNQTIMEFELGDDIVDTTKGVYLTVRAKANYADFPQDIKICAYEYDSTNSIKRLGTYDLSYMGSLVDSVALSERTALSNASYADLTFDISSYIEKLQVSGAKTFKVIFGFDYDQIAEYQAMKTAGNYKYTRTDLSFTIYPKSTFIDNYVGSGNAAFDGAAPRLTYYKLQQ